MTATIALSLAVVMLVDRVVVLWWGRHNGARPRPFAWLAVVVVAVLGGVALLQSKGWLVHSVELGTVMAQGYLAAGTMIAVIFLMPLGVAVLYIVGHQPRLPSRAGIVLVLAIIVGLSSVAHVDHLGLPDSPPSLRVFSFDVWWPPLMLWLCVGTLLGALQFVTAHLQKANRIWRVLIVAFVAVLVSAWALQQPQVSSAKIAARLGDQWTRRLWLGVSPIAALILLVTSWEIIRKKGLEAGPAIEAARFIKLLGKTLGIQKASTIHHAVGAAAFGPLLLLERVVFFRWRSDLSSYTFGVLWPGVVIVMCYVLPALAHEDWRRAKAVGARQWIASGAFLAAICLALDVFHFELLPPSGSLPVLIIGCALLVALFARSHAGPSGGPRAAFVRKADEAKDWVVVNAKGLLKRLFFAEKPTLLIGKAMLWLLLLIALNEVPNAGKTLITGFRGSPSPDLDDLGQIVSDKLFYRLRQFSRQLTLETLIPEGGTDALGSRRSAESILLPGSSSADAALAKSEDLVVGAVHIPVQVIASPIVAVLRKALGVQVVRGAIQKDKNYLRVFVAAPGGATIVDSVSVLESVDATSDASRKTDLSPGNGSRTAVGQTATPGDSLDEVMDRVAFRLLTETPTLRMRGMTRSWHAFQEFRRGFEGWNRFREAGAVRPQLYDTLDKAISHFRTAVKHDPTFAVAYYRLAVALRARRELGASIEALAKSVESDNHFATALNAIAFVKAKDAPRSARFDFEQVLTDSVGRPTAIDRAGAFFGLCSLYSSGSAANDAVYQRLSYFHCRRAAREFAGLDIQTASQVERGAYHRLGDLLLRLGDTTQSLAAPPWTCHRNVERIPQRTRTFARAALKFHDRAIALASEPNVRCEAALLAYSIDLDTTRLTHLREDPAIFRTKGDEYADLALEKTVRGDSIDFFFARALAAYDSSFVAMPEPASLLDEWAYNNYAYTVWRWKQRVRQPHGPTISQMLRAESLAVRAVELATDSTTEAAVTRRSTLAEIRLALGRPHDALTAVRPIMTSLPQTANLEDEPRLDLVRALRCAALIDERSTSRQLNPDRRTHTQAFRKEADQHLAIVLRHWQQFGRDDELIADKSVHVPSDERTRAGIDARCEVPRDDTERPIALKLTTISSGPPCNAAKVVVRARLQSSEETRLRLYGAGRDALFPARKSGPTDIGPDTVLLAAEAFASHDPLMLQIEAKSTGNILGAIELRGESRSRCEPSVLQLVGMPANANATAVIQTGTRR